MTQSNEFTDAQGNTLTTSDRQLLRQFITNRLSLDDIKTLCFDLNVDFEDFPQQSKNQFVIAVMSFFEKRRRLKELVVELNNFMPDPALGGLLERLNSSTLAVEVTIDGQNAKPSLPDAAATPVVFSAPAPATPIVVSKPEPILAVGNMLGIYRLDRLIGKGGMGEVWAATHTMLDEPRAIKVLLDDYMVNPGLRDRFINGEARNSLRLEPHPNIVRVYDVSIHQNIPYIVMEYVEGIPGRGDLKLVLRNKDKLSFEEAGQILNQIGSALQSAHSQNFVHRDVKPANILINKQGQAKLTDFGLLKDLQQEFNMTALGTSIGTPTYMSPEQIEGKATPQSDIYSLGVVIYELLAGKPPFVGDNIQAVMSQHLVTPPPPLRQFLPSIPEQLESVVLRALAKQPTDRYATATDFAVAYQKALRNDNELEFATQVLDGGTVALPGVTSATPANVTPNPNNLPVTLTSFIGRKAELEQVKTLLQVTRLLTLMGAGGTGKTRLSLETGRELLPEYKDGGWFVEFAPVSDPKLIEQTIISALGLNEESDRPAQSQLLAYLKNKQLLLILDNCEHLVDPIAKLADKILRQCPSVVMLASSREALNISGETTWRVPSLSSPDPKQPNLRAEQVSQYEGVKLFIERAIAAKPGFEITNTNAPAVAEICYQLDGIPLAIELAAARVRSLTPEEIAKRLGERFKLLKSSSRVVADRQQTLEALIRWSYDLLPEPEQVLWGRLSVFAGGWTLEAAENICVGDYDGGSIEDFEIIDLLDQLVNKSVVVMDEIDGVSRYRMLESIKQFGRMILEEHDEDQNIETRHAAWYLDLAERAAQNYNGAEQIKWINALAADHDNLRIALANSLKSTEQSQAEAALRLGAALWRFWYIRGYLTEGLDWLHQVHTRFPNADALPPSLKSTYARMLNGTGVLLAEVGKLEEALIFFEQCLKVRQELGNKKDVLSSMFNLGNLNRMLLDYEQAETLYEEALNLALELNDKQNIAWINGNLGRLALTNNDFTKAQSFYNVSLKLLQELADIENIVAALNNLAYIALKQNQFEESNRYYKECLQINQKLGKVSVLGLSLIGLAEVKFAKNDFEQAATLLGISQPLLEKTDFKLYSIEMEAYQETIAKLESQLGEAKFNELRNQRKYLPLEENIAFALELE